MVISIETNIYLMYVGNTFNIILYNATIGNIVVKQ